MNTKGKFGTLILVGGLVLASWSFAQTAFQADGIIESTQGGFKFPDGNVQTTAYNSSFEIYSQGVGATVLGQSFECDFVIPDGKILVIEQLSGFHAGDGAHLPLALMSLSSASSFGFFVPAFGAKYDGGYVFEVKNLGYVTSFFRITAAPPTSGTDFTGASCYASGRLIDAP